MMRIVPDRELAPYRVPWGPASASIRAMSYTWMSSAPATVVTGVSSRYRPLEGRNPACRAMLPLLLEMPLKNNEVCPGPFER